MEENAEFVVSSTVKEVFGDTLDFGSLVCTELLKPVNKGKLDFLDDDNISLGLRTLLEVIRTVSNNSGVTGLGPDGDVTIDTGSMTYVVARKGDKLKIKRQTIGESQPAASGLYRGGDVEISPRRIIVKDLLEGVYKTKSQSSGEDVERTYLSNFMMEKGGAGWVADCVSTTIVREMKKHDDSAWTIGKISREVSAVFTNDSGTVQFTTSAPKRTESEDHM